MVAPDFDALKDRKTLSVTPTWKPKDGENVIRVLATCREQVDTAHGGGGQPPDRIAVNFRSHFLGLGDELHVFRCPRDYDQTCPACNFYWANKDAKDEALKKMAGDFNNSLRFLMNIVDMSDPEKGMQPFECGSMIRNQILDLVSSARWGDCLDPAEGRAFVVTKGKNPRSGRITYSTQPDPETGSILEYLQEDWLDLLADLPTYIAKDRPVDQIEALVSTARQMLGLEAPSVRSAPEPAPEPEPATSAPEKSAPEKPKTVAAPAPAVEEVTTEPEPEPEPDDADDDGPHPDGCRCTECRLDAITERAG